MSWSEHTFPGDIFNFNTNQEISALYNSNRVVTHDELPLFKASARDTCGGKYTVTD
jgi:hypothetical protein